jgi:hypothetical protein
VKTEVEAKKSALQAAAKGGDAATLRKAMDDFNEALQKVGQHIYQGAGAGAASGGGGGGQQQPPHKKDDNVVDADYREVN